MIKFLEACSLQVTICVSEVAKSFRSGLLLLR